MKNNVLNEIVKKGYAVAEDGRRVVIAPESISEKEGLYIQNIISELNPTVTLEIGMAYGVSSLYICDSLKRKSNTKHIIIDPQSSKMPWFGIGIHNLHKAGYGEIIEHHDMKSYEALPQLLSRGQKIDFALIDGWHTFDYALVDFFYIDKMLSVGGVVVFDDADWKSIRKLCRYVTKNNSYSIVPSMTGFTSEKSSIKRKLINQLLNYPIYYFLAFNSSNLFCLCL